MGLELGTPKDSKTNFNSSQPEKGNLVHFKGGKTSVVVC